MEILVEDSQSDPNRAAEVATKLITEDAVDLMVVASTPETTNPVSDQCESNGVPCISTVAPWQPWVIGRGGTPGEPNFQWTYHFFWGLEDVIGTFLAMWDQVETNKIVGGLFPNDGDGNAWGDPTVGFPTPLAEAGYTIVDPGRYENGNADFTAQINAFKDAGAELLTGVVIPPDFPTFWSQARQQGFVPKVASIGKALLFPESIQALGQDGVNLSSEVWWSPSHPYASSLVGLTRAERHGGLHRGDRQPMDAAARVRPRPLRSRRRLSRGRPGRRTRRQCATPSPGSPSTPSSGRSTGSDSPIGNVAKTKLVGGQWREGRDADGIRPRHRRQHREP